MTGLEPPTRYDLLLQRPSTPVTDGLAPDTRLPPWTVLQGPLAREMGKLLRKLVGTEDPYNLGLIHGPLYANSEYRQWVRRRLREKSFMASVGAGIEMLPCIEDRLPYFSAQIERLNRPKTMPQMLRHLGRNLEWYLQPESPPVFPKSRLPLFLWGLACTGVSVGLGVLGILTEEMSSALAIFWYVLAGLAFAYGALLQTAALAFLCYFGFTCGEKPGSMKHTINAAELYLYLIELYEERPLVPLAAGDLSPEEQSEAEALENKALTELPVDHAETVLGEMRRRVESRS